MRNIITVIALVLVVGVSYGQNRNDLKGPAAKNYKAYQADHSESLVVTNESRDLMGPEAKNYNCATSSKDMTSAIRIESSDKRLKGPVAKNYKPWKNTQKATVKEEDKKTPKKQGKVII